MSRRSSGSPRAYQEPTLAHRPDITPGAVEAVRELRARGLRLGLISNTGRTPGRVLRRLLEDADLLPCFDVLVFSDEARVRKPAAAIFRRVLDEARDRSRSARSTWATTR